MFGSPHTDNRIGPRRAAGRMQRTTVASIGLWLALSTLAPAQSALRHDLENALSSLPHAETKAGAFVLDLATGEAVFDHDADEPLVPASALKLVVMATAVVELGPDFTFETVLATDGRNLIVVGDGDPGFGDEKLHESRNETIMADFARWADALTARDLAVIAGDLVIDESVFDDQWLHPTWEDSDLDNWYAAPVGGLNFNDNCVDITLVPATEFGAPVLVSVQPPNGLVEIQNKCVTGGKGTPVLHHPYDSFSYRVSGRCAKRWPFGSVSFPDPGLLFADSLRTYLAQRGVRVSGEVRRGRVRRADGSVPSDLTILARRSTSLADLFTRIGKDSQNLFAECLLKRMAFQAEQRSGRENPVGSWQAGSRVITDFVAREHIDTAGLVVADGSGLSRDNQCTARQLTMLLARAQTRSTGALLRESLSNAGVDGSLRRQLRDHPGQVYAKTGTMRGVRALAGYVGAPTPRYAFAVIFNNYRGPSTPYKNIQDQICRTLIEASLAD